MNDSSWNCTSQAGRGSCSHKPNSGMMMMTWDPIHRSLPDPTDCISGNKTFILPEYDGASSQIVSRYRRLSARDQPLQRRGWRWRKRRIIAAGWMSVSAVFHHPSPGVCVWIQLQTLRRDPLREPHSWVWSVVRNFPSCQILALFTSNSLLKLLITVKVILYLICCTLFNCQSCSKVSVCSERLSIFSPFLRETPLFLPSIVSKL